MADAEYKIYSLTWQLVLYYNTLAYWTASTTLLFATSPDMLKVPV